MEEFTYNDYIMMLIKMLEGCKGDKESQAVYLQAFIQQFGPVPNEYSNKIRRLME